MKKLSVKLSLLFVLVALVSIVVIAFWVNYSVQSEFYNYCQGYCEEGDNCLPRGRGQGGAGGVSLMLGVAELAFLTTFQESLWLAALMAVVLAIFLGLVFSRVITEPLRLVSSSARKLAQGDFSQRVSVKSKDEIGEMAAAFSSMAEQLDKKEQSRRQLLADIAHELRTPLSIIQGNLEAWEDGVIQPTPEKIAAVHDETVRLSRIITDLRDISLAQVGKLTLHLGTCNLADLIFEEIFIFKSEAEDTNVNLEFKTPDFRPNVKIDADRVRQVLRNLISNAIRYTPEGGSVFVSLDRKEKSWISVCVADTGDGIEEADISHVFDHFYKADKSRKRGQGGSGLGLAIVKQLVEAHGGSAWVESKKGSGSSFYFTLPEA